MLLGMTLLLNAAPGDGHRNGMDSKGRGFDNEEFYEFMVFKMTRALDLTTKQAEKFFPLYNEMTKKERELRREYFNVMIKASELKSVDDKTLHDYQKAVTDIRSEEVEVKLKYFKKMEEILTPEQSLKFMFFEERFRRDLVDELQDRQKRKK